MNIPSIITDSTITVVVNNKPFVAGKTHPNFYEIKARLLEKNHEGIEELFDVKEGYKSYSNGLIEIEGSNLLYNGLIIHNVLAQRIVDMIQNGDVVEPMIAFLKNVMKNPSEGSADQLYTFLEHKNLPFTEDGCFLAYKAINNNYTDKWTGSVSNKIGETVTMERDEVTANPEVGCSSGLHCGSIEYVRSYGHFPYGEDSVDEDGERTGDRLITVKVNPADVVSVPTDCSCQKLRTFKYVVHEEIEDPYSVLPKYEAPVYYDDDEDEDYGYEDEDDYTSEDEEWDEDESTEDDMEEIKEFMGHPSGDFGGARVNVCNIDEVPGIGDMDFLGEADVEMLTAMYDEEGTPIPSRMCQDLLDLHQKKTSGKKSLPKVMATPPPPPLPSSTDETQLPPPPPEIVIDSDSEESTVDTTTLNSDGLVLPSSD
jgi:hypothetical protein